MPNHCENKLKVSGKEEEISKFKTFAEGEDPWSGKTEVFCCAKFVKPPAEAIEDYDKVGYDWCCRNWGTKWGAYEVGLKSSKTNLWYNFYTAWSSFSDEFLIKASARFPGLKIQLSYEEPGIGFDGKVKLENGTITSNYFHDWAK